MFVWEPEEVIEENKKEKGKAGISLSLGKNRKARSFFFWYYVPEC